MSLFVATLRHTAESCPILPETAEQLLLHVSVANAARYGVAIRAEALIDGEHCMMLVLQARDRSQVERFLSFFERFGSVDVLPASSSETTIARGGCLAP